MAEEIEISLRIGPSHCDHPSFSSSAGILVGEKRRTNENDHHGLPPTSSSSSTSDEKLTTSGHKRTTTTRGKRAQCSPAIASDNAQDNSETPFYLSDSSTSCSLSKCSSSSSASSPSCHPPDTDGDQKASAPPSTVDEDVVEQIVWPPNKPDAKWKVRTLGLMAAILPAVGCYFCLAYTFAFQYDRVANFTIPSAICPGLKSMFPPVSYSIGVWKPQKYIWLMVLSLHIPPRFFYAIVHKSHYALGESEYRQRRWFPSISRLHYFLLVAEALGLLAVSVIDIESHFKVHAVCFALWLVPVNF
ncbi:hypothetical protein GPALN_007945 [Globodera pallida]|nr:hypothetical protein GPALN_007945 [Globodera pallida]